MDKQSSANDFQIISRLGQGAFGQVFKVKRKQDGAVYAMKKIKTVTMKEKDRQNALNEIRILASMASPYIIGYKDSFYDDGSKNLCIVLEFASQGDIMKKINDYSKKKKFIEEPEIWKAMVQIAKGIKCLHDSKILHRDLKSANIFIAQDGTYKLGDLNISKVLKQGLARTQTGTPYYCSPQVWQDKPYGAKSDVWSFGCVLYEMASQKPPFTATDIQGLYKKICAGVFPRIPNHYSNQLSDLINSMLKLNPSIRPGIDDILNNPIVQKRYEGKTNDMGDIKGNLLQTIQFNNQRGWKNINNNLPKPNYVESQQQCSQSDQLIVPNVRVRMRPLSSRPENNIQDNRSECRNRSNDRQNTENSRDNNRRERVMSACKNRNNQGLNTPQKQQNKNNLVLPPIDPNKRQRRNSGNNYQNNLPPKSDQKRQVSRGSRNNSNQNNAREGSRQRLQRIGQGVVNNNPNNGINYRINNPSPKRY